MRNSSGYLAGRLGNDYGNLSAAPGDPVYSTTDPRNDEWALRVTFSVFMGMLSICGTIGNIFVSAVISNLWF